jgi:hypothetical protein
VGTYNAIVAIAGSSSLADRVAAAAAQEGATEPVQWAHSHIWLLASEPGWADAWLSALTGYTINVNPDTGQRDDVITDGMILGAVQSLMAEEAAPPPVLNPLADGGPPTQEISQ